MNDLNKITNTRIGDNIHYYVNGKEDRGVVVKMNNAYVSVLKGNGSIDEIHINDTFFIKDILTNKTWNDMSMEERTVELQKAHAFSPRFLTKTWEDLPRELKDVLVKTNIEESTHGQIGGNRAGVSTNTDIKTPEDYKGETNDRDKQTKEEFKHDNDKPTVDKNNGMEKDHKKKDQIDGMKEDWRPTGGESDKQKNLLEKTDKEYNEAPEPKDRKRRNFKDPNFVTDLTDENKKELEGAGATHAGGKAARMTARQLGMGISNINAYRQRKRGASYKTQKKKSEPLWEVWLNKFTGGDLGEKPKNTTVEEPNSTLQRGLGNRATSKPNSVSSALSNLSNHLGEQNKRLTESGNKMRELGRATKKPRSSALQNKIQVEDNWRKRRESQIDHTNSVQDNIKRREGQDPSGQRGKEPSYRQQRPKRDHDRGHNQSTADKFHYKSYGKPLYGVTSLKKEGDGAGNSGVNSLETTGVYNARYSDSNGRYRDQQKDKE